MASKSGYYFTNYDKLQATADLKNYKIENLSCLFRPLAQYPGYDKRWVWSRGITNSVKRSYINEIFI